MSFFPTRVSVNVCGLAVWLVLVPGLLVVLCMVVVSPSHAQESQEQKAEKKLDRIVSDVDQQSGRRDPSVADEAVRIFVRKIEVLGHIEKPQAVFIVPGNDPRVDDIGIDRSFFKEIFRPVERATVLKDLSHRSRDFIPW